MATAVCLQLAAAVPNFLIQEHFDAFNEPWTHELVTWSPTIDAETGHLSLPEGPGLGIDLNVEVAQAQPYDPAAFFDLTQEGWELQIGRASLTESRDWEPAVHDTSSTARPERRRSNPRCYPYQSAVGPLWRSVCGRRSCDGSRASLLT